MGTGKGGRASSLYSRLVVAYVGSGRVMKICAGYWTSLEIHVTYECSQSATGFRADNAPTILRPGRELGPTKAKLLSAFTPSRWKPWKGMDEACLIGNGIERYQGGRLVRQLGVAAW